MSDQHTTTIILTLGRLEGQMAAGFQGVHRRMDDQRRELFGHIARLQKAQSSRGHGLWLQIGGIVGTIATSLLGFIKPEVANAIIRLLFP